MEEKEKKDNEENRKEINNDINEDNNNDNKNDNDEQRENQNQINDSVKEEKNEEENEKEKNEEEKNETKDKEGEKNENNEEIHERSRFSFEGGKKPFSMYTRRVMDISKIEDFLSPDSSRGQIGSQNLGNTCFMNSSIACLSNTTELTYYFLKGDYKRDINENNKLGMEGDLARSWGDLLQNYWVKETHVGDPSELKYTIGRKAKIFRGYGQQDSNEFMSVFLDYLNEDLNRISQKQYIELKEKGENETDEECSKRFWECNLRRNDSIITDLFYGQFKSTITCPDCGWINITFDPFDAINLPLLTQKRNYSNNNRDNIEEFHFFYIPKYGLRNGYRIITKNVNEQVILKELIERIKKEDNFIYRDQLKDLLIVDMLRKEKYGYAELDQTLSKFNYSEEYCYSYNFNEDKDKLLIPVYFYQNNSEDSKSGYPRMVLGNKNMSLDDLRKNIYFYIRKYILSPFLKENEKKDSLTEKIEQYINDKNLELKDDEKLFEEIEKEYRQIFKKDEEKKEDKTSPSDTQENEISAKTEDNEDKKEKQKCLENFIKDLPFEIFIYRERNYNKNTNIIFIDKYNFYQLPSDFINIFELKTFDDILDNVSNSIDITDYEIGVEFKEGSKYINKTTFNLNHFDEYSLDYIIKKEKKKKKKKKGKKEEEKKEEEKKEEEPKKEEEEKEEEKKDNEENEEKEENEEEENKENEEDNGKITLQKCLKHFCKEEQLKEGDEWYCSKCKKHVLAKKKMELYYLPKILIICFKRFIKDSIIWEKNEEDIDFPINNFDMKDFVIGPDREHSVYDLFAVSQHYGSTTSGHYTAVCKNDGKWFSYNDSSCNETDERDALGPAAYVLFYRRQTD